MTIHRYQILDVSGDAWAPPTVLGTSDSTSPRRALVRAGFDSSRLAFMGARFGGSLYSTDAGLVVVRRLHRDGGV